MKRTVFLCILALVGAALLAGCAFGGTDGVNETEGVAVTEKKVLAERICGTYCAALTGDTSEPDTFLDIYFVNGHLVAEISEKYAAYYAMELIVVDEAVLYDTEAWSVNAIARFFSGFSNFGEYFDDSESLTIGLTDVGVNMIRSDGRVESYVRSDPSEAQHDPEIYREMLYAEGGGVSMSVVSGAWSAVTADGTKIYLEFSDDGTAVCLMKRVYEPISIRLGLAAIDRDGKSLILMTERVGWGTMPLYDTLEFGIGDDGTLILKAADDCGVLPSGTEIVFQGSQKEGIK